MIFKAIILLNPQYKLKTKKHEILQDIIPKPNTNGAVVFRIRESANPKSGTAILVRRNEKSRITDYVLRKKYCTI